MSTINYCTKLDSLILTIKLLFCNSKKQAFFVLYKSKMGQFSLANSISAFFQRSNDDANLALSLHKSNAKTINSYATFASLSTLIHIGKVLYDLTSHINQEEHSFEVVCYLFASMTILPIIIHYSSIKALTHLNGPNVTTPTKSKQVHQFDINTIDFATNIQRIIIVTSICQLLATYNHLYISSIIFVLSFCCYNLTSSNAKLEYFKLTKNPPSPKKDKLNKSLLSKTPNTATNPKKLANASTFAEPRITRSAIKRSSKRVKEIFSSAATEVAEKYQSLEQNVHNKLSTIINPNSDRKAIKPAE